MKTNGNFHVPLFLLLAVILLVNLSCSLPNITISMGASATPEGEGDEGLEKTRTPKPDDTQTFTPTATATFTPTFTVTPSDTPTTPTLTPTNTPLPCNLATFISDVTIPDGTEITAGAGFTKTWQLKNIGSCTWTSGYRLIFDSGDRMNAPDSVAFTGGSVPPGATVNVSVNLVAPGGGGTYQGNFRLRSPEGVVFGIGNGGQGAFFVKIVSVEVAAPPPPVVGAPDLFIQWITLNPNPPVQGQPVQVKVSVYNQGNAAAGAYNVVWYAGSNFPNQACAWPVDSTAAHGGRVLSCNYPGYSSWYGSLTTRALVDTGNSVAESNEGNNTYDMNISVSKP